MIKKLFLKKKKKLDPRPLFSFRKQRASSSDLDLSVAVLEKGSAIGAHTLSGAAVDPRSLNELLGENWATADGEARAASGVAVDEDRFFYLSERSAWRLPTPPQMNNKKCKGRVLSLGELVSYLGRKAEEAGVDVFPGFAASALLLEENRRDERKAVCGVVTGDVGVARDGASHRRGFTRGVEVRARATLLAEGARGSLTQQAEREFGLRGASGAEPQTYALGLKEVWSVVPERHSPGTAWHTVGFPLPSDTYGGGFIYHLGEEEEQKEEEKGKQGGKESGSVRGEGGDDAAGAAAGAAETSSSAKPCRVSLGLVVGLDYKDPTLNPYQVKMFFFFIGERERDRDSRKKNSLSLFSLSLTFSLSLSLSLSPSPSPSPPSSTPPFSPRLSSYSSPPHRSSRGSRATPRSASSSREAPAGPTGPGRSTREGGSPSRGSTSPEGRSWGAPRGRSSSPGSRGFTRPWPRGSRPRTWCSRPCKGTTSWR